MADIFALRDSDLNEFLFAEIGVESNGTILTVLSLLARLGNDPWTEAAAWSRQPAEVAFQALTACIVRMPSNRQVLDDAPLIASRLIALLPAHMTFTRGAATTPVPVASSTR